MPPAVYVKLDRAADDESGRLRLLDDRPCNAHEQVGVDVDCSYCLVLSDVVAVPPYTNRRTWSLDIKSPNVTVKVERAQLPLVCATASTEHVLQGNTCDPGLIFHWRFPRRLPSDLLWLAVYVVLS